MEMRNRLKGMAHGQSLTQSSLGWSFFLELLISAQCIWAAPGRRSVLVRLNEDASVDETFVPARPDGD